MSPLSNCCNKNNQRLGCLHSLRPVSHKCKTTHQFTNRYTCLIHDTSISMSSHCPRISVLQQETRLKGTQIPVQTAVDLLRKVSEASLSRNRSTIIVPAGSSGEEGWTAFRNILLEINEEASRLFVNMENSERLPGLSEPLPGLSDDVGAGFISGHDNPSASGPELNVDRLVEFSPSGDVGGMGMSKVIRVDQKRFFFDLGSNNRGHFLRISEVAGPDRSSIILPLSGLQQFHEMISHFVEITKDRLEGLTGANVRTMEPTQR